MIIVDVPMPANCGECPLAYWTMSDQDNGTLICHAVEHRDHPEHLEDIFVDANAEDRPIFCPIKGGTGAVKKPLYNVWRVLGPGGPQETIPAYSLEEAQSLCAGCWDFDVTDAKTGKPVYFGE